jgi:ABC-2 type transport system ATP-binding protein
VEVDRDALRAGAPVADRVGALTETVRALDEAGVAVADIGLRRPTLDEVFLHLTGRRPETAGAPGTASGASAGTPAGTSGPNDAQEALA